MCDKLVFDLSQELEGTPNIFIRKDWINILDNQNGQYSANQCVIDTSQLSNSNKYLNYREAYLSIPLLLTLTGDALTPGTSGTSADYSIGLKNWFGSIVHSLTVDYNNTTIIQQTPFISMVNSFRLMTTLSWSDIAIMGSTIGFYPDDALTWSYHNAGPTASGVGVCNNSNFSGTSTGVLVTAVFNKYKSTQANEGFLQRQTYINYDPDGSSGTGTYSGLLTDAKASELFKSFISRKVNAAVGPPIVPGCYQISVRATVYLRHLHPFFNHVPLLKGVYMKMILNLNNSSCVFTKAAGGLNLTSTDVPVGGVQPLMISSAIASNGNATLPNGTYTASLSVGNICLNSSQRSLANVATGQVGNNIFLYVPAYTFNPVFESAYLSSPIKTIDYSDYYQYQILNIGSGVTFNNLITNGIANIKSVLLLPFFTSIVPGGAGILNSTPVYQSPFDPAGTGPTSPLCLLNQFNIVVSGQNAIYNTERYTFEHFNNQFQGLGINGAMVDGLSSGLINSLSFEMAYNYYYTNVSRMLPVEESVPKSISCVGINSSVLPINLWCFVEYGVSINIDILTGARV
jgi:hypothetical protein